MRHEHENARRHAYNTIAEANRHLDKGNIKNPKHHEMLTKMIKDATDTIKNLDDMDNARPYSNTNIGYNADTRQHERAANNVNDMVRTAMDVVDRILPHLTDDMDDMNMRRGVPGTGRARRVRADRYDMDDDRYDYDENDLRVVNMPRWRSARTGRFLPNLYGPRRVRRVRRRAEMDDTNDRYEMDDRYDDMRDDRYDDARYDTARYDNRYDDVRTSADHEHRMNDAVTRAAATAAADAATATAQRMTNNTNDRNDNRTIYPGTPVMPRYDERNDINNDAHRPAGPDMRR